MLQFFDFNAPEMDRVVMILQEDVSSGCPPERFAGCDEPMVRKSNCCTAAVTFGSIAAICPGVTDQYPVFCAKSLVVRSICDNGIGRRR